jgi:hypothetical protein
MIISINALRWTAIRRRWTYHLSRLHFINYIHTYHSRFIPEGVAEASQIFLRDAHVLLKLLSYEVADVTGGKPIAFNDIYGRKREVLFLCSVSDTTRDVH